jgi:probable DNA repair protein
MGPGSAPEVDAWLRGGGRVAAASERAARALASAYHRARRAEGLAAWPAPDVQEWDGFLRAAWREHSLDGRMILNPQQEQSLWAEIAARNGQRAALLEAPRRRVAQMAMEAHRLLCEYAPQFLHAGARKGWQQDAAIFSNWLAAFDDVCRQQRLLSAARIALELTEAVSARALTRAPLMLAGFDRILPAQRCLLDAWGAWRETPHNPAAPQFHFHRAADQAAELAACALACGRRLAARPDARLLLVTQDAASRRGEIERALLRHAGGPARNPTGTRLFEFSLGIPLKQVALARSAHLLLRWLSGPLEEQELDWLISIWRLAADAQESPALSAFMRALRRRGWQRTHWRFEDFIRQRPGAALPAAWTARMAHARRSLEEFTHRSGTAAPLAWAELVPQLLQLAGWPGSRALSTQEFQAMRRWQQVVDTCASLGFDGRRIAWKEFVASLERTMSETLFAPESEDAPIVIAGPAESAGLTADAIWFLGADEDSWPGRGSAHPLLPLEVQRSAGMPHALAQLDWDLAAAVTDRLLASAPEIHFSYARQRDGVEARPSRLILNVAGAPQDMPPELAAPQAPVPSTIHFEDRSRIPFPGREIAGGASGLTAQSQCPFKAFATARLGGQDWEPAEAGLTAAQRGQLLHAVLHSVWSGPPAGVRSHAELANVANIGAFVEQHVRAVLQEKLPAAARESMPRRYRELEAIRLTTVVAEWLRFEATRAPFLVQATEVERSTTIAGLALYAGFALDHETEPLGGLVFAKVRAGKDCFAGRVFEAQGQLLPGLGSRSSLVANRLEIDDLIEWRDYVEKIAQDFLDGRCEVNPRAYPETCERCGLQTLCRIEEMQRQMEEDGEDSEADDA